MAKAMTNGKAKQLPADAPDLYQFVGVDSTNSAANSSEIHAANDSVIPNSSLAKSIGSVVNPWLEYPRFYYGRSNDSDLAFILRCMKQIPSHPKKLRHLAALHYEYLFQSTTTGDRRRIANTWLHDVAKAYRARRGL
jgi:hypothetical protein